MHGLPSLGLSAIGSVNAEGDHMKRTIPTLIGFSAILTWSFLALLSTAAGPIPPFNWRQ